MATAGQWWHGARPRTLPAAVSPVLVGLAVAVWERAQPPQLLTAVLCLVVALALQVGVNYANDYSDGIRGTDSARVGPVRLVGQQLAPASQVRTAAVVCFVVAAVAGLAIVVSTGAWWLLLVGAAAIAAAWLYTGGPRPYGYAGLGELFVFVFFGLVAAAGTAYVQTGRITLLALTAATGTGLLAVAILVANNLRDIPGDGPAGKRTLAVRLGDARTRRLFIATAYGPLVLAIAAAALSTWWALLALASLPLVARPTRVVTSGATGRDLIPALSSTGIALLGYALLLSAGLVVGTVRA